MPLGTLPLADAAQSLWLEVKHERAFRPAHLRHRHEFHQIGVCLKGGANLAWWNEDAGFRKVLAGHRNIVVNPAEASHSIDWTGSLERIMLELNCAVVRRIAGELGLRDDISLHGTPSGRDDTIWHLAFMLYRDTEANPLASALYAESVANLLAVRLLKQFTDIKTVPTLSVSPLTSKQMVIVDEYIHTYLGEDIDVSRLAGVLNLGPLQFSRRLKARTNMSPHQYVTNKRINRACELLVATRQSIVDIGLEVGFSGQSHFAARFKQIVGATPREYRNIKNGTRSGDEGRAN